MKKLFILLSVLLFSPLVFADEAISTNGAGALSGKTQGKDEGAFIIQSSLFGEQSEDKNFYGHNIFRLEIGSGFGITGAGMGGVGLFKVEPNSVNSLVAIEPLNLIFSANTNNNREDYIEWMPMGAAGIQAAPNVCRIAVLGRAGAALGTLGDGGARTAYGAGAYLSCPKVHAAGEVTRIRTASGPVDLGSLTAAARVGNVDLGLRVESITTRDKESDATMISEPEDNDKSEIRTMATAGLVF